MIAAVRFGFQNHKTSYLRGIIRKKTSDENEDSYGQGELRNFLHKQGVPNFLKLKSASIVKALFYEEFPI